jgi:hypothetical protein
MQIGVESLRSATIVDEVLAMAGALGFVVNFPNLPSIFSELFANALEHGILNLPTGTNIDRVKATSTISRKSKDAWIS